MEILYIVFPLVVLVFLVLLLLGMCKVASDADDQSDQLYDSLKQAQNPEPARHPSVARAMGRSS